MSDSTPENQQHHEDSDVETVRVMHAHDAELVPAPTAAPVVFAFGTTLLFAGLVTNPWVSVVGLICSVCGIIGWWFDVLPRESMERIPPDAVRVIDTGPEPGTPAPASAADAPGRKVLPVEIPRIRAGILGGLFGGVAMAVVAVIWGAINYSIWMPVNLLAAMVLESYDTASTEQLSQFHVAGFFAALGIHASFSIGIGLCLAAMMPMAPRWPWLFSCIVGPVIWSLLIYVSIEVLDPTLQKYIEWLWFFGSQFAYGIVAGIVISRSEHISVAQFLSPAERMELARSRHVGRDDS